MRSRPARRPSRCVPIALAGAVAAAPQPSTAQQVRTEAHASGWVLNVEQDTFLRQSTDKDYTMGILASLSGRRVADWHLAVPLDAIDAATGMGRLHGRVLVGGTDAALEDDAYEVHTASFGVSAFTPLKGEGGANLARTDPIPNDRPYASIVYGTVRRMTARDRTALATDLTVGVLGTSVARETQTWIHEHISNDVRPGGWHHQISHGGEPTARYRVGLQRLLAGETANGRYEPDARRWYDVTADVEANAGYYTNAAAGVRVRLGRIESPFWGAERRPIVTTLTPAVAPLASDLLPAPEPLAAPARHRRPSWEAYAWASGGGTVWAYNALLQGQFRDSDVTLGFDGGDPGDATLNRFVGDYQLGATVARGAFSVTYQYNLSTPLFDGPFERRHAWGGIYVGFGRRR